MEVLLFRHPTSGNQFPAGTVEQGEEPQEAARREVREETGLTQVTLQKSLGALIEAAPDCLYVLKTDKVYSRPDRASFDWAVLRRGLQVRCLRQAEGFTLVSYEEYDRYPDPQYLTYQITGWMAQDCLAGKIRRHLFHLVANERSPAAWTNFADHHLFAPFWARLEQMPEIVWPQNTWWEFVTQELGYDFS